MRSQTWVKNGLKYNSIVICKIQDVSPLNFKSNYITTPNYLGNTHVVHFECELMRKREQLFFALTQKDRFLHFLFNVN